MKIHEHNFQNGRCSTCGAVEIPIKETVQALIELRKISEGITEISKGINVLLIFSSVAVLLLLVHSCTAK